MNATRRILISGAGVAGLTAAIWLGRAGFQTVIVERSPSIRADGFIISLSHASYQYARRLRILDRILALNPGIRESSYHDRRGRAMLTLDYRELFEGVEIAQIMRDDLQTVLYDTAADLAEFRFDTVITAIEQHAGATQVSFSDGRSETFDIVIGADGIHSNTRALAFAESAVRRHWLGLASAAYKLPNVLGLENRFENHMEQRRYMCVYTTRGGTLACVFIWQTEARSAPAPEARREALADYYRGAPPLVERVLAEFPRAQTVYMDPLTQIEMQRWSQGNVVLLGDAAHGLTLLSGQGASSAFWGASCLANALIDAPDTVTAFRHYENEMHATVTKLQGETRLAAKWYVPRNWLQYQFRDAAMRGLPNAYYQAYFKRKYTKA